jgi:hypothetical protein
LTPVMAARRARAVGLPGSAGLNQTRRINITMACRFRTGAGFS